MKIIVWLEDHFGRMQDDGAVYLQGGGTDDGGAPVSFRLTSYPDANWQQPFISMPLSIAGITANLIGVRLYVMVQIITDGQTLTTGDIWPEVQYLSSTTSSILTTVTGGKATLLDAPTPHQPNGANWVTPGIALPVRQYMMVSFVPQAAGDAILRVYLARPSTQVWFDSLPQVSAVQLPTIQPTVPPTKKRPGT